MAAPGVCLTWLSVACPIGNERVGVPPASHSALHYAHAIRIILQRSPPHRPGAATLCSPTQRTHAHPHCVHAEHPEHRLQPQPTCSQSGRKARNTSQATCPLLAFSAPGASWSIQPSSSPHSSGRWNGCNFQALHNKEVGCVPHPKPARATWRNGTLTYIPRVQPRC